MALFEGDMSEEQQQQQQPELREWMLVDLQEELLAQEAEAAEAAATAA